MKINGKEYLVSCSFTIDELHALRHWSHDRRNGLILKSAINADRIAGCGDDAKVTRPIDIMCDQTDVEVETDMFIASLICEINVLREMLDERK